METESFREQRRRRREQQAFENFREYALHANLPDAEAAAERAAKAIHGEEAAAGREQRQRAGARLASERTVRQREEEKQAALAAAPAPRATPARSSPPRAAAAPASSAADASAVPRRLEDRTKEQLYARAQELEIEGRSQMTKDQLIEAIREKNG